MDWLAAGQDAPQPACSSLDSAAGSAVASAAGASAAPVISASRAAASGAVTSGPPGALPGTWADVEVLSGLGPDARTPAALGDALEAYGRGDPPPIPASECAHAVRLIFEAYRAAGAR